MTINKTVTDGAAVFQIDGWLDTQTAPEFETALNELDSSVKELTIDMSGLEYISSAGLRQIVAAHKKMEGRMTVKNVSAEVMDIFNMTGIGKRITIE